MVLRTLSEIHFAAHRQYEEVQWIPANVTWKIWLIFPDLGATIQTGQSNLQCMHTVLTQR